jgi:hypothetical protein
MTEDDLPTQIERLNRLGDGFLYRAMLAGMLGLHGRDAVVRELIADATRAGRTVVSIAAAPNWCRTRKSADRRAS